MTDIFNERCKHSKEALEPFIKNSCHRLRLLKRGPRTLPKMKTQKGPIKTCSLLIFQDKKKTKNLDTRNYD